MSKLVQNYHLSSDVFYFYLQFHLGFACSLHADLLFYFLGQGKAESRLFLLSSDTIRFLKL